MSLLRHYWSGTIAAALVAAFAGSASAQLELKIMAPAAPGGGWDQTARSMQQALVAEKIARKRAGHQRSRRGRSVGIGAVCQTAPRATAIR